MPAAGLLPQRGGAGGYRTWLRVDGKGFSLVEIVTSCPTNWGLEPLEALGFLEEKMFKEFPLGVIRDKDKEGA